jgi:hypothetical protein
MKKVVILAIAVVAFWLGFNYYRTGKVGFSGSTLSAEAQKLQDLEQELASINAQIAQAGRTASMTGMDTTGDVSALMEKKAKLEKEIAEAKKLVR